MERFWQIVIVGYSLEVVRECEFDSDHRELQQQTLVQHSQLNASDADYGSQTEAVVLHYAVREGETVRCYGVTSLYPYISKYFKFPVGHPEIHVGDSCQYKQTMLSKLGLIKYSVLPPKRLFHPVLPFHCNKKLLFCLCSSAPSNVTLRASACTKQLRTGP